MNAEDFYKQEFEKDYELIKDIRNNPFFNLDSVLKFAELYAIKGKTYWQVRCEAAENYIEETPCDPDIYPKQIEAYQHWNRVKDIGVL